MVRFNSRGKIVITQEFLSADLVRLAFVLGMVLSVFLYEKSQLTTGSIVVPGFLGIHLFDPAVIVFCIANACICYFLVHKIVPRFWLLENRSKFHAVITCSVLLQLTWSSLAVSDLPFGIAFNMMAGFGFVIPGLIAHDMSRNGCWKTAANVTVVSYLVGGIVFACLALSAGNSLNIREIESVPTRFNLVLILALSTIGSIVLKSSTSIRSGGYVTAAYFVFLGMSFESLAAILISALTTYWLCSYFLIHRMIVFGRRKFALMLIVGAMSMWSVSALTSTLGISAASINHPAYAGIMILLPGLIANDMNRTSVHSVLIGIGILASCVFVTASIYYEIRNFSRPEYIFPLIGCLFSILLVALLIQHSSRSRVNHFRPLSANSH